MPNARVAVMGSFVADLAFRTPHLPAWGETVLGSAFRLGPGGKGSNQAVAAARLGAAVSFISKLGNDPFGDLARRTYEREGIDAQFVFETAEHATGGASVVVDEVRGENAIVVVPGASFQLTKEDVDAAHNAIAEAAVFMTQLELPLDVVDHGLRLARSLGVMTILNPAPALGFFACDYATPNESEAFAITGESDHRRAADILLAHGARNVVITLGAQGALAVNATVEQHVAAFDAGPIVETTGAGDAFNGGFATALAEGADIVEATRFGCAVAGISVTRHGTAPSMPQRSEVDTLLKRG